MAKYLLAMTISAVLLLVGCSGDESPFENTINIQDLQYRPFSLTISAGTTVTWLNTDETTHTVTSGRLTAFPDPTIQEVAIINSAFVPERRTARVGDTVRWTNRDIATQRITFLPNQAIEFVSPPFGQDESVTLQLLQAGAFQYTSEVNPASVGTLLVEGMPEPDGGFDSDAIQPNETFSLTFNTIGTFTYFCKFHNVEEGRIIVQ